MENKYHLIKKVLAEPKLNSAAKTILLAFLFMQPEMDQRDYNHIVFTLHQVTDQQPLLDIVLGIHDGLPVRDDQSLFGYRCARSFIPNFLSNYHKAILALTP
jgi:hypothetical protein